MATRSRRTQRPQTCIADAVRRADRLRANVPYAPPAAQGPFQQRSTVSGRGTRLQTASRTDGGIVLWCGPFQPPPHRVPGHFTGRGALSGAHAHNRAAVLHNTVKNATLLNVIVHEHELLLQLLGRLFGAHLHERAAHIIANGKIPPTPVPTRARLCFKGQKCRNTGSPFGEPRVTARHVPRNTCLPT